MADYTFNIFNEETDFSIRVCQIGVTPENCVTVEPQKSDPAQLTCQPQSGNFVVIGIEPKGGEFTEKTYMKLDSFTLTEPTYFKVKRENQNWILQYGIPNPNDPETTVRIGEDQ
ncbi:MAG: hypothetical protein JSV88_27205 [Candidatus Aminicenantes bacterium]|nr:MAG: hypothetical protein JSV88_27205 [Candidatus Aminicenantes bacterium]